MVIFHADFRGAETFVVHQTGYSGIHQSAHVSSQVASESSASSKSAWPAVALCQRLADRESKKRQPAAAPNQVTSNETHIKATHASPRIEAQSTHHVRLTGRPDHLFTQQSENLQWRAVTLTSQPTCLPRWPPNPQPRQSPRGQPWPCAGTPAPTPRNRPTHPVIFSLKFTNLYGGFRMSS